MMFHVVVLYLAVSKCFHSSCKCSTSNLFLSVGRKLVLGLLAYIVSNVGHVQWTIPQTRYEDSMFFQVRAFFISPWINFMGFLVMVGMNTAMAEASNGVMSDTLKQRINGQTVRGRPTFHLSVNLKDQCSH